MRIILAVKYDYKLRFSSSVTIKCCVVVWAVIFLFIRRLKAIKRIFKNKLTGHHWRFLGH